MGWFTDPEAPVPTRPAIGLRLGHGMAFGVHPQVLTLRRGSAFASTAEGSPHQRGEGVARSSSEPLLVGYEVDCGAIGELYRTDDIRTCRKAPSGRRTLHLLGRPPC